MLAWAEHQLALQLRQLEYILTLAALLVHLGQEQLDKFDGFFEILLVWIVVIRVFQHGAEQ